MRLDLKTKPIRFLIEIKGKVQGVGFRPTVYRYAIQKKLTGWVSNSSTGVIIEVQETKARVEDFIETLKKFPPARSEITAFKITEIKPKKETSFKVLSSISGKEMKTRVSPDIAVCKDCLRELFDDKDRRYLYPFINCTNCGPRFTIIKNIPYDRSNTTMKKFKMCKSCQNEYDNPSNRRFHAQPNACEICGPQISLIQNLPLEIQRISGTKSSESFPVECGAFPGLQSSQFFQIAEGQDSRGKGKRQKFKKGIKAIEKTTELLKDGKIVAIKGLGGFHLACDALNDKAVKTLRSRKYREDKPFALMAKDLKTIKQYCEVSPEEEKLLLSWKSPIVILKKKIRNPKSEIRNYISKDVAPNNKYLGFMLPYTPLHHLLFKSEIRNPKSEILVMTSGNISDEPIAYDNDEAVKRLQNIADYFLINNRDIYIRSDDSVTRIFPPTKKEFILRRSRGYVPDPIISPKSKVQGLKSILAVGAHSKNTFAIAKGDEVILSHHIGDMENVETYNSFVNGIEHFKRLLEVKPQIIAHDLHPEYLSTQYAKNLSSGYCLPRASKASLRGPLFSVPIQHHHAHIASVMADNMLDNRKVIGIAFDGTGLGSDGNLWGGEFLIADYADFKRIAHFKYVPLPGGGQAIKESWRIAFSYLYSIFGNELWKLDINFVKKLDKKKSKVLQKMLDTSVNSPLTSSVGRLFDAVASLIGIRDTVNYEGQAAIELEMMIDEGRGTKDEGRKYRYTIKKENNIYIIDMEETIKEIIKDIQKNISVAVISEKFHNTIVELIVKTCIKIRSDFKENHELRAMSYELNEVALGGGVFQNMFLLTNSYNGLKKAGFKVYIHEKVPTNDGGLSLGQAVIVKYRVV